MTADKEKTKFGKFLQKVGMPVIRAAVKFIPFVGTPIAEIITNVTLPKGTPKKHTNVSIVVQVGLAVAVLADIIFNKGENLLAIIDLVGLFPAESIEPVPAVAPVQ